MAYYILSTNLQLLQTIASLIDQGEGYPKPGGYTLHHAIPETRHDGAEYALLADDVQAKYPHLLAAVLKGDGGKGSADQVAADLVALKGEQVTKVDYTIPAGKEFKGVAVQIGEKAAEWIAPDVMEKLP